MNRQSATIPQNILATVATAANRCRGLLWALLPLLALLLLVSLAGTYAKMFSDVPTQDESLPKLNQNDAHAELMNAESTNAESQGNTLSPVADLFTRYSPAQTASSGRCQLVDQSCDLGMAAGWGAVAGPKIALLESQVFLPLVSDKTKREQRTGCFQNPFAEELARLMQNDIEQERGQLQCIPALSEAAQARATNMARNNYISHIDPKGRSPHYYIRQTGYSLPEAYTIDENFVESIAAGYTDPSFAWGGLLKSPQHRQHVLGEVDFFRSQECFGVGYVSAEDHLKDYYTILTAPCPDARGKGE